MLSKSDMSKVMQIPPGASMEAVEMALGKPDNKSEKADEYLYHYKTWSREIVFYFKDNKLVRFN